MNFGFEYWQTGIAVFVEFFGGMAILLGLTRPAAFGIIIVMLVGIWVAHLDNGFYPTYDTYGYQLCLIGLAYVLTIVGENLSLDKRLFSFIY